MENQRVVTNLYQKSVESIAQWLKTLVGSKVDENATIEEIVAFQIIHEEGDYTHGIAIVKTNIMVPEHEPFEWREGV